MCVDKVTGAQGKDSPDTLEEKCDMYIELKLFNKAFEVAAKIKDINRLIEVRLIYEHMYAYVFYV